MKTETKLWNRSFTCLTLGTVVSAIGGVAMSLALSLVIFDQTESAWLTSLFVAVSLIPGILMPLLLGPFIDRCRRSRVIWISDYTTAGVFLVFGLWLGGNEFSYGTYLLFSLVIGCLGSFYNLAYNALYPDLIPAGMAQKGYSVGSLIYPTVTTVITPVAAMLYQTWGIRNLILVESALLFIAATFEIGIREPERTEAVTQRSGGVIARLRASLADFREGLRYLKQEKGVRSIYLYMSASSGLGEGSFLMVMTYFQSGFRGFTTAMYSLLISAEMLGRMVGGVVHYCAKIAPEKRYRITAFVYFMYGQIDGLLLFFAYPVMLVLKFLAGFMGVNSATLREASTQNYIPQNMRGRVNGVFGMLASLAMLIFQLVAGALGEWLSFRTVALLFGICEVASVLLIVVRNREHIRKVYETDV